MDEDLAFKVSDVVEEGSIVDVKLPHASVFQVFLDSDRFRRINHMDIEPALLGRSAFRKDGS